MPISYYILWGIIFIPFTAYLLSFILLQKNVKVVENQIINTFLQKTSKIPGIIEVMRPMVADKSAFNTLISLHTTSMMHDYKSIYALLEHNERIHREFLFLMKLSVQIPHLQKNAQFLYIREFIILYEKNIKNNFSIYNKKVIIWNRFIFIKNLSIIGFILPGKKRELI